MEPNNISGQRMTRRRMLYTGVGSVSVLSLPGLLAACGGSSAKDGGATSAAANASGAASSAAETAAAGTTAAAAATSAAAAKTGGTLKFAIGDAQSKDSLDPALALTSVGTFGHGLVYDTLLASDVGWNLTPMLASDYTISPDATTHTFRLRDGVLFHSGKKFTSADVAEQFKRVLDEATGSAGLSVLGPVLDPTGISTPDPTTIIFTLKTPDAFFGQRVTHYTLRIPEAGTTDWLSGSPGTGPFKNVSFRPGEGFEFERNGEYWQDSLPYLDGVAGVAIPDPATKVQALLSGDAHLSDSLPSSAYQQLEASDIAALLDLKNPSPFTFDVDGSKKPYSDVRVQQAMKMLIDRQSMLDIIVGGRGIVSADSLISPEDPYYPADLQPYPRDPEKAKALLAEAGYADGFTEKVWTTSAYPHLNEGAAIGKQNMAEGGITFEIENVSNDRYLAAFLNEPIVMDYGLRQHPVFMFQLYYMSSSASNLSRLKDDQIDAWIGELIAATDPARQKEIGGEIIRRYNEVSAELIPFHFSSYWGGSKKLQGWRTDPVANVDLRQATLA